MDRDGLVKMSELARRSGVPAPTIKHYIREGLLPAPALRTSRNMAWYDPGLVPRIKTIKELQGRHYLPLQVIRELLETGASDPDDQATAVAIRHTLADMAPPTRRGRTELLADGQPEDELDWLRDRGLVEPELDDDGEEIYAGDDLELLATLRRARAEGITEEMLPVAILEPYFQALKTLATMELQLFRGGVMPRAGDDLPELAASAVRLSERLVVLLRRRALLPALQQLVEDEGPEAPTDR